MFWLKSALVLLVVGGAHLQCFTPDAHIPPLDDSADLTGAADFGFDLYKRLTLERPSENFFFSPYSIWAALVMVYFGAAGNTQTQLEAALRLSDKTSAHRLAKGLEILYKQQINANISLDVANRAYFNESFALLPCVHSVFPEELRVLNFYDAKNAAEVMNSFVSQTTRGLINSIVTEKMVSKASMVLINAIYFKGFWKHEFEKTHTQKRNFFISQKDSVSVDMMSQTTHLKYGESTQLGARVLELPYAGSNLSMILLLPNSAGNGEVTLTSLVEGLNGAALQDAISPRKMSTHLVHVLLPKFSFRAALGDDLKQVLKNIGITDLFSEKSDLSQFSSEDKVLVTDVLHKAYVDVNEEGTEAAATTAVIGITFTSFGAPPRIIEFHCDKPFVFLIYDRQTDNILFVGDIKNPNKF